MKKFILSILAVVLGLLTVGSLYLFSQLKNADIAAVILFPILLGILIVLLALDVLVITLFFSKKTRLRYLKLP